MRYHIPAAVLGAAVLLACGQDDALDTQRDLERDTAAMVSADTVVTALFVDEAGPDARLLFVGEDGTIRPAGHEDALFVPLSTFSVERDGIENEFPPADSMASLLEEAGVRGDRFVIVGEPIPAGRAYAGLDYLGLGDRAVLLDGGLSALDAGGQTPGDTTPRATNDTAAAGTRTADATRDGRQDQRLDVDPRDDMIVDAEWVHERLDDPEVAILDARPPDQFSGETPGDGIDRPGHIPGARNVFWQDLVRSEQDPRLRDEAELRRIFEEAGVGPDDTIVAYCRTGGQGSFLYTVARHLGYDVRLYDGSFVDWSRTDYEVER